MKKMDKRGITLNIVGYWIMALAVLFIIFMAIALLFGTGTSAIEYIKDLIRFGR